jgi:hypothetical protein
MIPPEALDDPRAAAEMRRSAMLAAAGLIARSVPDLPGLIDLLEHAGGSSRLVAALRARPPAPATVGGLARPDPAVWAELAARRGGRA